MRKTSLSEKLDRAREASILEVVEKYVGPLRHKGKCWMCSCPFHDDNSPSFAVYPHTNSFYCFGCAKSGDVITFVQEMEGCSFREAVASLAECV